MTPCPVLGLNQEQAHPATECCANVKQSVASIRLGDKVEQSSGIRTKAQMATPDVESKNCGLSHGTANSVSVLSLWARTERTYKIHCSHTHNYYWPGTRRRARVFPECHDREHLS